MTLDAEWAVRRRAIERGRYWIGPNGPRARWHKAITGKFLPLAGLGLWLIGLYGRGRRNALDIRRVEMDIVVPGLPNAFDGYRILHVSDTHLDALPELVEPARRLLADVEVDLLVVTGDVHGHLPAPVSRSVELLAEALRDVRVRGARMAVLGNHDAVEMLAALADKGFDVDQPVPRAGARRRAAAHHRPR